MRRSFSEIAASLVLAMRLEDWFVLHFRSGFLKTVYIIQVRTG